MAMLLAVTLSRSFTDRHKLMSGLPSVSPKSGLGDKMGIIQVTVCRFMVEQLLIRLWVWPTTKGVLVGSIPATQFSM